MINTLKNISLLIITGILAWGLMGCAPVNDGSTVAVQAAAPQSNAQKQKLYTYLLAERNIDVIKVGETRTIVIASDELFTAQSANFNSPYVDNLKVIAQLINSYDTTNVAVTAYTDQPGDTARALTEKQAQKVLVYLKKHGVDTRLIYAKGYGNLYPVSIESQNAHFNRRIEIKFQFHKEGAY